MGNAVRTLPQGEQVMVTVKTESRHASGVARCSKHLRIGGEIWRRGTSYGYDASMDAQSGHAEIVIYLTEYPSACGYRVRVTTFAEHFRVPGFRAR